MTAQYWISIDWVIITSMSAISKVFTIFLFLFFSLSCTAWITNLKFNSRTTQGKIFHNRNKNHYKSTVSDESWLDRDEEIIIDNREKADSYGHFLRNGDATMFDKAYNDKDMEDYSIANLSIRDISEAYQFSIPFLSDYVASMGCRVPLDADDKIGNYMVGDQVYKLLLAITSIDPLEANTEYDTMTLSELAYEMGIEEEKMLEVCGAEGISLPFLGDSVLHKSIVDQIQRVAEYEQYSNDDEEKNDDDTIDIESLM